MKAEATKIPRRLDDPLKFLLWDADVVGILFFAMGIGIITGFVVSMLIIGIGLTYGWSKFKSGKHKWFMLHGIYWILGMDLGAKRTPKSHVREFLG